MLFSTAAARRVDPGLVTGVLGSTDCVVLMVLSDMALVLGVSSSSWRSGAEAMGSISTRTPLIRTEGLPPDVRSIETLTLTSSSSGCNAA